MVLLTLHSIIQKLHLLGEAKAIFNYVTNTHYKAKQKSTLSEFTFVFEWKGFDCRSLCSASSGSANDGENVEEDVDDVCVQV